MRTQHLSSVAGLHASYKETTVEDFQWDSSLQRSCRRLVHPATRNMFEYSGHSNCRDRAHDLTRTAQREAQAAATSSSSTRSAITGISNAARHLFESFA